MTRRPAIPSNPFRRACHPLLLAAVALACDPARAALVAALNLVPPPLPLRPIPPPPYALESGIVTDIAALWRRHGGSWEPGMNVLLPDLKAARGRGLAVPAPSAARPAWTSWRDACPAMTAGPRDDLPATGAGR